MRFKRSIVRSVLVCGVAVAVACVVGESVGQRSMARNMLDFVRLRLH